GVTLPNGRDLGGVLTTPDILTMHHSLAVLRDGGAQVVALEASSIGIEQGRLDQVHIDVAGFTNLTRDHLDYHLTQENYKRAKFALFQWPGLRRAIVNADDAVGAELLGTLPPAMALSYSLGQVPTATIQAQDIQVGPYGLVFKLITPAGSTQVLTRLVGEHNISNLLLLAGVLQDQGWDVSRITRVLAALRPVPGRLQIVEAAALEGRVASAIDGQTAVKPATSQSGPMVVVDYAHTPDALERALSALRPLAKARGGKLVCVFGCGGSRDSGKRPIMGGI